MKKILIISPYFPPVNAPDMQRVRMSLPYYSSEGWKAEVVTVDPLYTDVVKDKLLVKALPADLKVHYVSALPKRWTQKFGLGSIALRSLRSYYATVNRLLANDHFDLIYFSTTQFPVCLLGRYWLKKYKVPYVIDFQDPWHSDYYQDKPQRERPPKYWFSYRLNKLLEPFALKNVSGLISVSESYLLKLKERYSWLDRVPASVITFGHFEKDLEIAKTVEDLKIPFHKKDGTINLVYIGRGGYDMSRAFELLMSGFKTCLLQQPDAFEKFHFHFIGTSYAPKGTGVHTILPIAEQYSLEKYVTERPDRVSFYENIKGLSEADALLIPGSDDGAYTASKIYPYLSIGKPMLAVFNPVSSSYKIIKKTGAGVVADLTDGANAGSIISNFYRDLLNKKVSVPDTGGLAFLSAKCRTADQVNLFEKAITFWKSNQRTV